MSNFDQKVEVITDFLVSRARLGRFTTFSEVGYIAGKMLNERGYRSTGSSREVSRDKVADVLAHIAQRSVADDGFILPALVMHANDNGVGHRFAEWAQANGIEGDSLGAIHRDQIKKVFAKYGGDVQLSLFLIDIPGDLSSIEGIGIAPVYSTGQSAEEPEYEDYDGDDDF